MNQERQRVENKKVGQGLTELVERHPTEGRGFITSGNSLFDDDKFPTEVAEIGASTALVSDPLRAMNSLSDLSLLQVQDTLTTPLRKLAPNYRQLMPLRPIDN
jgi:hypothetical protein